MLDVAIFTALITREEILKLNYKVLPANVSMFFSCAQPEIKKDDYGSIDHR